MPASTSLTDVDFERKEDHQMKEKLAASNPHSMVRNGRMSGEQVKLDPDHLGKPSLSQDEKASTAPKKNGSCSLDRVCMPHPHYDAPSVSAVGRRTGESDDPRKCGVNPRKWRSSEVWSEPRKVALHTEDDS
jgi:hypothetical protein